MDAPVHRVVCSIDGKVLKKEPIWTLVILQCKDYRKVLTFKFDMPGRVVRHSFYYMSSSLRGSYVPSIACMTQRSEAKSQTGGSRLNEAVQRW